jgi:hypothetical protein
LKKKQEKNNISTKLNKLVNVSLLPVNEEIPNSVKINNLLKFNLMESPNLQNQENKIIFFSETGQLKIEKDKTFPYKSFTSLFNVNEFDNKLNEKNYQNKLKIDKPYKFINYINNSFDGINLVNSKQINEKHFLKKNNIKPNSLITLNANGENINNIITSDQLEKTFAVLHFSKTSDGFVLFDNIEGNMMSNTTNRNILNVIKHSKKKLYFIEIQLNTEDDSKPVIIFDKYFPINPKYIKEIISISEQTFALKIANQSILKHSVCLIYD